MKKRPLWPLLPPVTVVGTMWFFILLAGGLEAHSANSGLECAVVRVTGFYCPGCGGTRCAQNILQGNWLAAFGHNPLLMSGFALIMAFSAYLIIRITILGKTPPRLPNISSPWIALGLTTIALFTILRNIPVYPFGLLAP